MTALSINAITKPAEQVLERALAEADEAAFAAVVHYYAPRLHRYLSMLGLSDDRCDDLVQESFVRVHRHRHRFDRRHAFSTWLYTIGKRLALNELRRPRQQAIAEHHAMCDAPRDGMPELWRIAQETLQRDAVELLWLRYGEDREPSEIAEILGVAAGVVRVRMHRARKRLEVELQRRGLAPEGASA